MNDKQASNQQIPATEPLQDLFHWSYNHLVVILCSLPQSIVLKSAPNTCSLTKTKTIGVGLVY